MFRSSVFDKLLEKATDQLQLEPNYAVILQICDTIRQGECQPKHAVTAITKKISHDNPHVANFGLLVLESVVKNCGSPVHNEIGTPTYMEQLRELHKTSPHEIVKNKILELLQAWAFAFRNDPKYRAVQDIVQIMKAEGHAFPPLKESDAMFKADTAPEWADGNVCFKCRIAFGVVTRKHHCRACGQVFCHQCSSKTSSVPKYGFEREVRVCDQCHQQINSRTTGTASSKPESDLPAEYLKSPLSQQSQTAPRRTEEELREEEELQLALALSQSEAEEKEKQKSKSSHMSSLSMQISAIKSEPILHAEQDPEMARYLDRSYWDQKSKEESNKVPSAPSHVNNSSSSPQPASNTSSNPHLSNASAAFVQNSATRSNVSPIESISLLQQNGVTEDNEIDEFVNTLRSQVEIFVNRMKSNSSRGRSISNDSSVQTLFMNITAMHSRLLRYIQQQDDSRVYYEGLQDKLAQVKDARAALDALRFEHREKLRQQAEEAEKLRQMQMAQKLDIMRQKKQEYLQYQRQLALQRIQEQEREMQMRQEQQKQQYIMGGSSFNRFMTPGGVMPGSHPSVAMPPSSLPPYSAAGPVPPMYSQQGPPSFVGHQMPFPTHMPQGVMAGSHLGSHQPGQITQSGPGGSQPGQMGPGGHQPGQMGPGGHQQGQMGPGGPQPGQMGPGGPQPGQMGPGGPQPGQMGPGGPQPGQMGPGGPQPGQMGPGGPQPGQMGPGGLQPGQMGPGGPQPVHMGPPGPQQGQMGPGGPQPSQMAPGGPQPGQMMNPNGQIMGPRGSQSGQMGPGGPQIPQGGSQHAHMGPGPVGRHPIGQLGPTAPQHGQIPGMGVPQHMAGMGPMPMGPGQDVKRESEELISFD